MESKKFYFMGYEDSEETGQGSCNSLKYVVLFVSDKASSLYEALKEFENYKINNRKNFRLIKILEGSPDYEVDCKVAILK